MSEQGVKIKGLNAADFDGLVREILGRGGRLRFQARGCSMHPFIQNGDTLVVEPVAASQLRRADIVLWRRPWGSYAVHRLLRVHRSPAGMTLITKGDNAASPDLPVAQAQVMGRVIEIERAGRRLRLDQGVGRLLNGLAGLWLTPWAPWGYPWLKGLGGRAWRGLRPFLWENKG